MVMLSSARSILMPIVPSLVRVDEWKCEENYHTAANVSS
jgi:hypothetical protein